MNVARRVLALIAAFVAAFIVSGPAGAEQPDADGLGADNPGAGDRARLIEACVAERIRTADDDTRIGDLRHACAATLTELPGTSPVAARGAIELSDIGKPFTLLAHRPTYLLPWSYNAKVNDGLASDPDQPNGAERTEAGFQISFKFPIWRTIFGSDDNLYMAYTNRSFWQVYDKAASSPFRSTDHEPEIFWRHMADSSLGPFRFSGFDLGIAHQSNGRSRPLSRSWNRAVGAVVLSAGDVALGARAWLRLPEDADDDDNPDIEDYIGHGELRLVWAPNRNTFTLLTRAARKGGAVELTWSRRLTSAVRLYAQYFNGFGETLIDYDHRVERISIGIALNDYLVNDDR